MTSPNRVATVRVDTRIVRIKLPNERRSLSRSATRALDIMETFGQMQRPLRAVEIARIVGLQPSTTNQLLKTMVDSGHLTFDARSKTYLPSLRLLGVSRWIKETYETAEGLGKLIQDLQERTGLWVTLSVPNDLFMQVVDLATPLGRNQRGLKISIFGSAVGSAYLSTLAAEAVNRLAKRARIAPPEIFAIADALDTIRRHGVAQCPSTDGSHWSIAIPLVQRELQVPIVLGVGGPAEHVFPRRVKLCSLLREAIETWTNHCGQRLKEQQN